MVSLLYAAVIIFLYWVPTGIFLHGFYSTKYDTPQDINYNLNRDMKTWAPLVAILLAWLVPDNTLTLMVTVGIAFEAYLVYASDGECALSRFKRYVDDDEA